MARLSSLSTSMLGDRDELQPLVVDPHELVGDDLAQRLAEPGAARVLVPASWQASACSHRGSLGARTIGQSKTSSPRWVRFISATSEWASVATAFHRRHGVVALGRLRHHRPEEAARRLGAGTDRDDRRPDVAAGALKAAVGLLADHERHGTRRRRARRTPGRDPPRRDIRRANAWHVGVALRRGGDGRASSVPIAVYSLPTASLPSRSADLVEHAQQLEAWPVPPGGGAPRTRCPCLG